jgi:hypothetical protein
MDKQLQFSNGQAITVTAVSTNIVDLGPPGPNGFTPGAPTNPDVWIHFNIPVAFTAAGAATLAVQVQSSVDAAFTSPITHTTLPAVAVAALTAGATPFQPVRLPFNTRRYVRLNYVVATGPMTAGTITATGGADPGTNIGYGAV